MTKDVTVKEGGLPANIENMQQALIQSATNAGESGIGQAYLKFAKGDWEFGAENTPIEDDSVWAVNPLGFQHGWTCWDQDDTSGGPKGERLVAATLPMPEESKLPELGGTWSKCVAIQMRCTNGEDEGVQVLFKTNSHGGRKFYHALIEALVGQLSSDPDSPVALITLYSEHYRHKEYGKVYNPLFELQGWASMDGLEMAAPEGSEDESKARRKRVEAEPEEPEEEPSEPEDPPTRRRRRRRA